MINPGVLIVDEPTRGIDVGSKSEIYGILSDLAKQGMAIIVVSSEIEEIMGVCDSVITVFEGKKTSQLPITDDLSREEVLKWALGGNFTENFHEVLEEEKEEMIAMEAEAKENVVKVQEAAEGGDD